MILSRAEHSLGRNRCKPISWRTLIALPTGQDLTEGAAAPCNRCDPQAVGPRRIVADVLIVSTFKLSDPEVLVVSMKANDSLIHGIDRV